ncbi:PH domain-containing protein [Halobaculum sp. CBA1158]|uniref:PH domain-containing protein n=1 Tax=Halobaculum sp. CBA1158 TaxID=2904243 RepID=UPI001F3B12F2|nr:PH domain-containing protein [Halobaculum sp. CBA1158]UIO99796.1 PH domain-containing protein [Halobaculum sp. CBA1158]
MSRGLPAVWSAVAATPFLAGGGYVLAVDPSQSVPPVVGLPIAAFGLFIFAVGLYVHYVAAPDPPTMREGEEVVDTRSPDQKAAAAKTTLGLLFLLVTGYLLFFTLVPYAYPMVTFVVGLFVFSKGLHTFWTNTLTTYYVTTQRLIKEYRFLSLVRHEVPFGKVRAVEERKSAWEALVGLGSVRVASGGGATLEILIRNISTPTAFADEIRSLL